MNAISRTHRHSRRIVTHAAAYGRSAEDRKLNICTACAALGVKTVDGWVLGRVTHGERDGYCDVTAEDFQAAGIEVVVV